MMRIILITCVDHILRRSLPVQEIQLIFPLCKVLHSDDNFTLWELIVQATVSINKNSCNVDFLAFGFSLEQGVLQM